MRFLTTIFILILWVSSEAQIINGSSFYRPIVATGGASLLLDTYSGAAAAYSLRKLRTAYSGSAIRVRRSSDNTEQDIGFTSNGDLDTASLKTFVGSNNGFVTKWYDQSGNTRDAAQTTAANQPRIVSAGVVDRQGGKCAVRFTGNLTQMRLVTASFSLPQPVSVFVITQMDNKSARVFQTGDDRLNFDRTAGSAPYNFLIYGGSVLSSLDNRTTNSVFSLLFNSTSSYIYINSVLKNSGNAGSLNMNSTFCIGGATNLNSLAAQGTIQEIILYASNQSSNRTGIESNINSYYSIY